MKKTVLLAGLICTCLLFYAGCSFPWQNPMQITGPAQDGNIRLQTELTGLNLTDNSWHLDLHFRRGKHALFQTVSVDGTRVDTALSVPAGTWDIEAYLTDEQGIVHFQDSVPSVTIWPDRDSQIILGLRPADATISLRIDLTPLENWQDIRRIRVYFGDERHEISLEEPTAHIEEVFDVGPGSYDFQVELFTETFRSTDLMYPGVFQSINVLPSADMEIEWFPALAMLDVIGELHLIPQAPDRIDATTLDDAIILEWSQSSTLDIAGYHVFHKYDLFGPYEQITDDPVTATSFTHRLDLEEETAGDVVYYCVAAVSNQDTYGYRSPEIKVRF